MSFKAIKDAGRGSQFVRADLHIHSFGPDGSSDVDDKGMTPEAVVDEAVSLGLGFISITDHNTIGNVGRAIAAADDKPVFVVPGVELSTPGGHLLVYAPDLDSLERIYGLLTFDDERTACQDSMVSILEKASSYGGIAIAAHIDTPKGMESVVQGYGDPKKAVITSPTLVGVEISNPQALTWYTPDDENQGRRELLNSRIEVMDSPFIRSLPRIQSSDAHSLNALRSNYEEEKRLTRIKAAALDWHSFRAAFADPEARIRIENEVPEMVPQFLGMSISGGFLDETVFGFSPNLTCIIGGRGSGKSTAFQALRAAAGQDPEQNIAKSDAWPNRILLAYRDESGEVYEIDCDGYTLSRSLLQDEAPKFAFDSLSQGDMARTIEKCHKDPGALLEFMDTLLELEAPKGQRLSIQSDLRTNGEEIERLQVATASYKEVCDQLKLKTGQVKLIEDRDGIRLVQLQENLTKANVIRQKLEPDYEEAVSKILTQFDSTSLDEFEATAIIASGSLGNQPAASNSVADVVSNIKAVLSSGETAVKEACDAGRVQVKQFVVSRRAEQTTLQRQIDQEVTRLTEQGIRLDMKFIRDLSASVASLRRRKAKLELDGKRLQVLRRERVKLLRYFRRAHATIFASRSGLATTLEKKIRDFLIDWKISVSFGEGKHAPDLVDGLKSAADWHTSSVPKAEALIKSLGATGLLDMIADSDGNQDVFAKARGDGQAQILRVEESRRLAQHLGDFSRLRLVQEAIYDDLPNITVSRTETQGGAEVVIQKRFADLSIGQQQSIVLAVLLSTERRTPLLIDQPEDNLDAAFIFQILVRALRRIKERRQVILVTHNANIAVLGDTDLVIPLKATAIRGVVLDSGTVEQLVTRDLVCEILEGSAAAYKHRGKIYGLIE